MTERLLHHEPRTSREIGEAHQGVLTNQLRPDRDTANR
jgi:hypothetical protein